jgi:YfiH family protein
MPELQTANVFEWVRYPWGRALCCRPLSRIAHHCFTTREPAIPPGHAPAGEAWDTIARAFGLPRNRLVGCRQVHGAHVVTIRMADPIPASVEAWGAADASVTDNPDVALTVRVADCVPVLVGDQKTGATAAIHAGWRGAVSGVVAAAVRQLESAFSSSPADLVAAIGPSIGPCCYRVGAELRDRYREAGHSGDDLDRWFTASPPVVALCGVPGSTPVSSNGRDPLWLDMWRVVSDQLALAGLASINVHTSRLCTSCGRDRFHSYRVDGPGAGRMAGVIRMSAASQTPGGTRNQECGRRTADRELGNRS